jgi:hypothetical protein
MISTVLPPASDPEEQRLRVLWYTRKAEWEADGRPDASPSKRAFDDIDRKLSDYLWNRVESQIAEDRRRHPKARRNAPVGSETPGGGGRHLP